MRYQRRGTILYMHVRHVHLLMLGYAARLVFRGEEGGGSIEKHKSTLAMIPTKYFTIEVPDYLFQSCSWLWIRHFYIGKPWEILSYPMKVG